MKIIAVLLVVLAGIAVSMCVAQEPVMPKGWWLVDQTLDAKTLEVKSEQRLKEYEEWSDCARAQAGRISKVTGGIAHIFVCRHYQGEVST